jgi:hypothetical protein
MELLDLYVVNSGGLPDNGALFSIINNKSLAGELFSISETK